MARLDEILDKITDRHADGLELRVGEIPSVRTQGRSIPIQKVALTDAQFVAIVREVASPSDVAHLERREPFAFSYRGFDFKGSFEPGLPSCEAVPSVRTTGRPAPNASGLSLATDGVAARPRGTVRPASPPAPMGIASSDDDVPAWRSLVENNAKLLIVAGVAALIVLGSLWWWMRPVKVPNIVMTDADGNGVTLKDMRQRNDNLLIVFLLPNCPVSKFALATVKELYTPNATRLSFAGLYFGTQADAEQFKKDSQVPFPVYGLKDAKDPFAVNDLIKKVGVSGLLTSGVYGGTSVLIDAQNRVVFKLEKDDVRQLPEKLKSALN